MINPEDGPSGTTGRVDGECWSSLRPSSSSFFMRGRSGMNDSLDRRKFLCVLGVGGLAVLFDWPFGRAPAAKAEADGTGVVAWKRSGRRGHVSRAAKAHNANHLYASFQAAVADLAHPGDKSKVVPITIHAALFAALFRDGRQSADLRHDLHTLGDFADLRRCLAGPGHVADPSCTPGDLTGDGAIDLQDVAASQLAFTPL